MLQTYFKNRASQSPLGPIVEASRRVFGAIGITSGVVNVLTLTGSIFMMQVYDRVIASNSLPTLYALALLAILAYMFQGWLETLRARMLALIGEKVDVELAPMIHAAALRAAGNSPTGVSDGIQAQRDLESIRGFVGGAGLIAMFDMPWILLYVLVTTLLHPLFGLTTAVAALLLLWLTWRTEVVSKPHVKETIELGIRRQQLGDGIVRNSEVIAGNGMFANMARRLGEIQTKYLAAQRKASFVTSRYGNTARTLRMVLQSFVLGLGAYLALQGKITAGAIIGASILVARALAPIDQAINSWRPFVAARDGHDRIVRLLGRQPPARDLLPLPKPSKQFAVKDLIVATPGGTTVAVAGVTMTANAGQAIAVIGQSAAGKSSLFRAIVGAWKLNRGQIEFDGTNPDQWPADVLGRSIGYLPQNVQLFEGTIAQNIARFDPEPDSEKVRMAADKAGLDAYIRKQFAEFGYNTPLSAGAENLSGGQRQRIGLARAMYGDPFLVVLDEPTSNLDQSGRDALAAAIRSVRARGGIVLVSAHDESVWSECDLVLALNNGKPEWFGPRDEVLARWRERYPEQSQQVQAAQRPPSATPPSGAPPPAALPLTAQTQNGQAHNGRQPVATPPMVRTQPRLIQTQAQPQPQPKIVHTQNGSTNGGAEHPAAETQTGDTKRIASKGTWSTGTTRVNSTLGAPRAAATPLVNRDKTPNAKETDSGDVT